MSMMKARRTLTTVQSPTAVDQFLMSKMPSNPTARQEWCRERLLERSQQVLANWNIHVLNQMKLPRRRRKRTDDAVWMKSQNSMKEKSTSNRRVARFNAKTNCCIESKEPCKMQLFLRFSSNTPIVYTTQATAKVSNIIKWYKKKNNILSHDICLSTSTGFKLCEALTLEDNGVGNDSNIYVSIADIGLKGGADDKGSLQGSKTIDAAECRQTIREWSKEDVRRWTTEVVQLDEKYVEALFKEEVDGETLVLYEKEDLRTDFEMKRGPIMKLERNLKALRDDAKTRDQDDKGRIQLPVNICDWTVNNVERWLISIHLDKKYVKRFKNEEVDGRVLKLFTAERIDDLTKEFKLPLGPMRKLLYHVGSIVRVSDTCTGTGADKQSQQAFQQVTFDTRQEKISHSDKKTCDLPKGRIDQSTHREKQNKEQATLSKIQHRQPQKYIKLLTEKTSLDLKLITEQDISNYNKTCSLSLLYSKWGKAENLLEKQFCFLILAPKTELTQKEIELIWAQLQKNCRLLVDMLPVEKKQLFAHKSKSMQSTVLRAEDKQPLSIRNTGVRMCPLMQKNVAVITAHSMFVVLVDKEMLTPRNHLYITHLDEEKNFSMLLTFDKNCQFTASYDSRSNGFNLTFSKRNHKDTLNTSSTDVSYESAYSDLAVKEQISKKIDSSMHSFPIEDIGTDSANVRDDAKDQQEKSETCPTISVPESFSAVLKNASLDQCQDVKSHQKSVTTCKNHVSELTGKGAWERNNIPSCKSEDGNLRASYLQSTTSSDISSTLPSSTEQEDERSEMVLSESNEAWPIVKCFTSESTEAEQSSKSLNAKMSCQSTEQSERDDSETLSTTYRSKQTNASRVELLHQKPRLFDCQVENYSYSYMRVLEVIEMGVIDLIQPVHEYKQFTDYANSPKHKRLWIFTRETIRFASACLNDRTNGTIHFGIADNKTGHYEHGQIIGFEIDDKTEYEEKLNKLIGLSFVSKEHIDSARKCIRPPKFIPVLMIQGTKQRYVIEVDIVPHSTYCGKLAFFVTLPKEAKIRYKKADLGLKALYRREGSTSSKLKNEDMNDYFQKHLNALVEIRQAAETQITSKLPSTASSVRRDNLAKKLTWLLCSGQKQLDSSFYPILVVNRLTADHTNLSQMRFIQEIDWVAVFDFDHLSQTSGICKMYSEHKVPNIQDPDMYLNVSDVSAHREEIHFPEKTCWIFCNGRTDIDHRPLNRVGWNMDSNRSRGVKEAVRFFGNAEVIPEGRAIIVFLILSEDYDVMLEVFREFSTYFTPMRLMCIAENEESFQGWAKGIVGKSCTMDVLQRRSVVGMPVAHINETILRMRGVKLDGQCILPSSTGAPVTIKQRDKTNLSDLEILSMNECEEETKSMDNNDLPEFLRSKELLFYQGYPVSWWNFWANDNSDCHVLKRTKHDELKKHVQDALTPETREEMKRVPTVLLYHQPGAGGTTLTKYILWEFKSSYRCCLIKRVTSDTANQLFRLWSYNEKSNKECKPILAAVEKLDEVVFIALQRKIEELWIKKGLVNSGNKPICVLLHCKCYIFDGPSRKFLQPFESVTLDHALTETERQWFSRKLDELEKKKPIDVFPTHLISFMILKENFSHDYIKNTVSGILEKITKGSPEDRLLKFVALLNRFVSDSSLPVSCCDRLMGVGHYGVQKHENQHIEFLLSPSAKLLLLEMQKVTIGSVKAFKIVHPLVAEEVLRQIMSLKQENIANVTLEFLKSELFKTNSHAKEDLRNMTSEMLKRRKKHEYGDDYETKFSPLIMKILEYEQNDEATDILLQGMELFEDDAMMTQQVARMYLFKKKFEEAKRFAEKAVHQKPDNSFLLDTLAEVYKEQMNSDYMQVKIQQQKISPKEAFNAIDLGFRAMEVCQRSQKASLKEKYSHNTSGYIKEVETCFRLMEILLCVEPFCTGNSGCDLLHKYLVVDDFQPKNLSQPWAQYHRRFKALHKYIQKAIDWMTNYCTFYKDEFFFENSPMQKLKLKLYDFSRDYVVYFGEDSKEPPLEDKDPENASEWRRRKVSTLGCNRFRNIFNLAQDVRKRRDESQKKNVLQKFIESKKLLQENKPMNDFDLHGLISLNLAISNLDPTQKGVSPLSQIHEMVKQYTQMMQGESLYPYFFQSLLMWPRENIGLPYDPKLLQDTLKQLKALFSAQQKHKTDEKQIGKYKKIPITQFKAKPATVFFLGKLNGLRAFIHTSQLQNNNGTHFDLKGVSFWDSTHVRKRLKRLKGIVWSQNVIRAYDVLDGNKATIEILSSIPFETVSSRDIVSFYLGFSWNGPVAYNVSRDIDEQELGPETLETRLVANSEERTTVQETVKPLNYQQYRRQHSKLTKALKQIIELKKKKNAGKQLEENQLEKLNREDGIKEELANLERKYQKDMESNPEFLQDYY